MKGGAHNKDQCEYDRNDHAPEEYFFRVPLGDDRMFLRVFYVRHNYFPPFLSDLKGDFLALGGSRPESAATSPPIIGSPSIETAVRFRSSGRTIEVATFTAVLPSRPSTLS